MSSTQRVLTFLVATLFFNPAVACDGLPNAFGNMPSCSGAFCKSTDKSVREALVGIGQILESHRTRRPETEAMVKEFVEQCQKLCENCPSLARAQQLFPHLTIAEDIVEEDAAKMAGMQRLLKNQKGLEGCLQDADKAVQDLLGAQKRALERLATVSCSIKR